MSAPNAALDLKIVPIEAAIDWHPRLTAGPGHRWLRELRQKCTAAMG